LGIYNTSASSNFNVAPSLSGSYKIQVG